MTTDALAEALSIAASEGLIDLQVIRAQALAKILSGGGEITFIINASLNGTAAAQECKQDAGALLVIVQRALDLLAGNAVSVTYADFSPLC